SQALSAVVIGSYKIPAWYMSPYPQELVQRETIFICEFCLQYFATANQLTRHALRPHRFHPPHPPGAEIYRAGNLAVWEVDGAVEKVYCQNLCLLSKLFLSTKTLYTDVEPFWFYVLTEWTEHGARIVGYFSKEKQSFLNYNLSCIMTLPQHQRKGYGKLMIEFSYLLSIREGVPGSPEKPLSDLGLLSYRSYWREAIVRYLHERKNSSHVSVRDMSETTGILDTDLISTLQYLGFIKQWRSQYVIL
ncbi:uncharacterized protein MONBRDRAFT_1144, partial [Monosiga brevicollis MX1]